MLYAQPPPRQGKNIGVLVGVTVLVGVGDGQANVVDFATIVPTESLTTVQ